MGRDKTTSDTSTTARQESTQQAQRTPEEQRQIELALEREEAAQANRIALQEQGANLINQLLTGGTLPGFLGSLPGGISPEAIGEESARVAAAAQPGFQSLGIADSGVAFRETAKDVASRVQFPAEQFNIGNLLNLLNLGVGGQAQVQAPIQASSSQLGGQLAGLRSFTSTGSSSGTSSTVQTSANPFLKSFQTSLGQTLGSPGFSSGPFSF